MKFILKENQTLRAEVIHSVDADSREEAEAIHEAGDSRYVGTLYGEVLTSDLETIEEAA